MPKGIYIRTEEHKKNFRNAFIDKHWKWKKGLKRTECICKNCKNKFNITPSEFRQGRGRFCSTKCSNRYNSKIGNNSYRWKGGITPLRKKIRESTKYKQWRQDNFIRDNFTCQDCGERGGNLEVHHKKPFYKLLEEIKKYLPLLDLFEGAMIYTPLWDTDNGITLCNKCHSKQGRPKERK